MITIGKIVHYFDGSAQDSPSAAIVTHVHSSGRVNITVFCGDGTSRLETDVHFVKFPSGNDDIPYCCLPQSDVHQAALRGFSGK